MKSEEILVSIPHGGTEVPAEIRALIPHSDQILQRETDLYTGEIYGIEGIRHIACSLCRAVIDVNRAPDEIYTEGRRRAEGVVMLALEDGRNTFAEDPALGQIQQWVETYHRPFHRQLQAALQQPTSFIIDGHSYRSRAAPSHPDAGTERAQISIGNREYCSCSAQTTDWFRTFFQQAGYTVAINDPYPGRFILGTYCNRNRLPGIQIEIRRDLYLQEETLEPDQRAIAHLNTLFHDLVQEFCQWDDMHPHKKMTDLSKNEEE